MMMMMVRRRRAAATVALYRALYRAGGDVIVTAGGAVGKRARREECGYIHGCTHRPHVDEARDAGRAGREVVGRE